MLNKEIYLIVLVKFLKNILQLLTGLQFDICYVINTRVGFEIAEVTRFLNYFRAIHLLFKICSICSSAIMAKWKCLKLLHSSKGMCRMDSQLKNRYVWNIQFLEHLLPFWLYSVGIL